MGSSKNYFLDDLIFLSPNTTLISTSFRQLIILTQAKIKKQNDMATNFMVF